VPVNISGALVKRIARDARTQLPDVTVVSAELPTEWRRGLAKARRLIGKHAPDVVIHFGVSKDATGFVIERRGVNACVSFPDGVGELPPLAHLDPDGPSRRLASLPVGAIVKRLKALGLPVAPSNDAGEYLCNAVLYQSLSLAACKHPMIAGFVHIPQLLPNEPTDRLSLERAVFGGIEIIAACVEPEPC
jgi:pyroglutamyl-peptidase